MIRRKPPEPDERCRRTRCIRKAAVIAGKVLDVCPAHLAKKGKSRYGVKRVKDSTGREYQSKAEREGMAEFRLREAAGEISRVREQVSFWLYIDRGSAFVRCVALGENVGRHGLRIEGYRADVVWRDYGDGEWHVGDFKRGLFTDDFRRKARWMLACGWPVEVLKR